MERENEKKIRMKKLILIWGMISFIIIVSLFFYSGFSYSTPIFYAIFFILIGLVGFSIQKMKTLKTKRIIRMKKLILIWGAIGGLYALIYSLIQFYGVGGPDIGPESLLFIPVLMTFFLAYSFGWSKINTFGLNIFFWIMIGGLIGYIFWIFKTKK